MAKADQAESILNTLSSDLKTAIFNDAAWSQELLNLKLLATQPTNTPSVYTQFGLQVLAETAFASGSQTRPRSSLAAAKIIANALLLQDSTQQVFAELGYGKEVVDLYAHQDAEHEFVGARILFLLTYKSKLDFVALIEGRDLLESANEHLKAHLSRIQSKKFKPNSVTSIALTETLKLLYNLASRCPAQMHFMSKTIAELVKILSEIPHASPPLDAPIVQLLNALALIDWPSSLEKDNEESMLTLSEKLIQLLDRSTSSMKAAQMETMLITLITVIRKLNELPYPKVQSLLRLSLLPQDEERDKPLGQSHTLASRLLRLQTSAGLTILPDAIAGLLFELSDRDAAKFVHNIGYGHAAGYLMTHKIPIPEELVTTASGSSGAESQIQVNPVTGQRLDAEVPVQMPEMTDAEKEREAERLFVLFERLKATGVVNVENPLRAAAESGRLEKLSDGESD